MPVSDDFRQYVLEQLGGLGKVTARRMFGGVGLYHGDVFFALIDDDTLYLKVDESNRPDFVRRGMKPFCPFPNDPSRQMGGYYEVPADVLEDAEKLVLWSRNSSEVSLAARKAKRQPPPKRSR